VAVGVDEVVAVGVDELVGVGVGVVVVVEVGVEVGVPVGVGVGIAAATFRVTVAWSSSSATLSLGVESGSAGVAEMISAVFSTAPLAAAVVTSVKLAVVPLGIAPTLQRPLPAS
jgi:non-canonical (house-cleaning) NTP pyrophosphatase